MRRLFVFALSICAGVFLCTLASDFAYAATSTVSISVTVGAATTTTSTPPVDEGGGQGFPPGPAFVTFVGYAYPGALITITRDGVVVGTVTAANDSTFDYKVTINNPAPSVFGLFARDTLGLISATTQIGLPLFAHGQYRVEEILISPTISAPGRVYENEPFEVYGSAYPLSMVRLFETNTNPILLDSFNPHPLSGYWSYMVTPGLLAGSYRYQAISQIAENGLSSDSAGFTVAVVKKDEVALPLPTGICTGPDINQDGRVDIVDFSIFLFWWSVHVRTTPGANICVDFNNDNNVDIVDFSIMMYAWTN